MPHHQQISYIAPAAPARRRPATGQEPFLRPEIGFTPRWFRMKLGIDFGKKWHTDLLYRRKTVIAMRAELRRRFPGTAIGGIDRPDSPLDLLTGMYGGAVVAGIYGIPLVYAENNWPNCRQKYLTEEEIGHLEPPDLDTSPLFQDMLRQAELIASLEGRIEGYVNWQGILNNAQRIRGNAIFLDMLDRPEWCLRFFEDIFTTMTGAMKRLNERQHRSGVTTGFVTVSNCLVNMISPTLYRDLLLPFDKRLEETSGSIAIHNCAWKADPYLEHYASIPDVGYIDMGLESDLARAKVLFPHARRAVMLTPKDLSEKTVDELRKDLERIAGEYAPCDVVAADIDAGVPDGKVLAFYKMCEELSRFR